MGGRAVPGTRGSLLIVDDSSTVRRSIERHIFSDRVTEIYQAANGREAMELFERYRPEFVTMDLTMPEMDGVQCIREMLRLLPNTSILVVSALNDKATAIAALKLGGRLTLASTPGEFTEFRVRFAAGGERPCDC